MIAYLDCASGISGDKFLAALISAGADADAVLGAVAAVGLDAVEVDIDPVTRGGIAGLGLRVVAPPEAGTHTRTWADIRRMLEQAALPGEVASRALAVFEALATAEARVHGVAAEDVHFHEVGAADSIVDIVGTVAALHALDVERLISSPVALGGGTVDTAHGTLPVPAPATAVLLEGLPAYGGPVDGELTTPTGAALVRVLADGFGHMPAMTVAAVGHGAGSRELAIPNVARVILGTLVETGGIAIEHVTILETNLDHLTPEELAFAAERLAEQGALDVWRTPVAAKKGRTAIVLSVLARPEDADRLTAAIHELTGTLGVRRLTLERSVLERDVIEVETRHGRVHVKRAYLPSGRILVRAEYEDCAALARKTGVPFREVAEEAEDAARSESESGEPAR